MKRIFTFFVVAMVATAMMAQAKITFAKTTHDFGSFDESEVKTCVFTFTNTGDEPLIIHQAYSSCGCTVPTFPKEAVKPGEKGEIKVQYTGKGKFPGTFKKAITVRSNSEEPLTRLYIQGVMTVNGKTN